MLYEGKSRFHKFLKNKTRVFVVASLCPVAILTFVHPANADIVNTEFTPNFGSSISYTAVAGAALTVGAGTTSQGNAGTAQLSDASASSALADAFVVKSSMDSLSAPATLTPNLGGQTLTPGV